MARDVPCQKCNNNRIVYKNVMYAHLMPCNSNIYVMSDYNNVIYAGFMPYRYVRGDNSVIRFNIDLTLDLRKCRMYRKSRIC